MIYFFAFLAILLIISGFLLWAMVKGFQNPVRKHDRFPTDLGIKFDEINFPTKNDCNLYGWWIEGKENAPLIIFVHGWGRNAGRMLPYIEKLHPLGYHLLAFDSRHHGRSDKDRFSSMIKFAEDIEAAISFAEKEKKFSTIGLLGLSIGGAASIYAASFDARIASVVTVGAFANPKDVMTKPLKDKHIPYYPLIWLVFIYLQKEIGKKFHEIAPENLIFNSNADFLIIHGTEDLTVDVNQARRIANSAKPGKARLWILEGRGHSNCHEEKNYWPKIVSFFSETLHFPAS